MAAPMRGVIIQDFDIEGVVFLLSISLHMIVLQCPGGVRPSEALVNFLWQFELYGSSM